MQRGADIDAKNQYGNIALILSAKKGHLACVKYLVMQGADINVKNVYGDTAFTLSAGNGHIECENFFLTLVKQRKLNLQGIDFRQAILPKNLSGVNFTKVTLPTDLSYRNLTYANLTGHRFTATNFEGAQLQGAILASTLCDYQQCFKDHVKVNKLSNRWFSLKLPKDLKSIAQVYPHLSHNSHKAALLQIASGLAYLPY